MNLFEFDLKTLGFLNRGRPVKDQVTKAAANAVVLEGRSKLQQRANELAQLAFKQGRVSAADIESWLQDTKQIQKDFLGANAILAAGGKNAQDNVDWDDFAVKLEDQHTIAERVAARALAGGYGSKLESGNWLNHVGNMANAGRSTYANSKADNSRRILGHDEFKRILGGSDHCEARGGLPSCQEAADADWTSYDELIQIGDCACHDNCNCSIISRRAGQAERLGF